MYERVQGCIYDSSRRSIICYINSNYSDVHIRAGTTIYSDEWSAYNSIGHSQNFVDPVTGIQVLAKRSYLFQSIFYYRCPYTECRVYVDAG